MGAAVDGDLSRAGLKPEWPPRGTEMSEFENEQIPAETAPAVQAEAVPEPAAVAQVSEPAPEPEAAPAVEAAAEPAPAAEAAAEPAAESAAAPAESAPRQNQGRPAGEARPPRKQGEGKPRGDRPPRPEGRNDKPADRPDRGDRPKGGDRREGGERRDDRSRGRDGRPGGRDYGRPMGRPDLPVEIEIEKLMADSLYLDNQAHAVVSRIREMDAGTRSQVRRLFSAVRRACRAAEADRQHQFVMLRARLAYTIARHQLRSLDPLERLLLQVTRKNDPRAYERFRDLFEAIVAYNE
jgi:CRISPR type III-A-associated protein Csm2